MSKTANSEPIIIFTYEGNTYTVPFKEGYTAGVTITDSPTWGYSASYLIHPKTFE